jgi:hypothetical protein
MQFRLEFEPKALSPKINIADNIMLLGSCFTEHMNDKLRQCKFNTLQNPHGVLFNPISISNAIKSYSTFTLVDHADVFFHQGIWNHWSFHSSRSKTDADQTIASMNNNISAGNIFLQKAGWLIITFGSAFVYEINQNYTVANCHKMPAHIFNKRMLQIDEIVDNYTSLIHDLAVFNPALKIIFTVSPVRHSRDGFVENNRSKSVLLLSIERIISEHANTFYFPSYELVIDDLRDYRFYAEDMVHPNYLATQYVWEKFSSSSIDGKSREIFKELEQINNAVKHRPLHPNSDEHKKFIAKFNSLVESLSIRFPSLNFDFEKQFFTN